MRYMSVLLTARALQTDKPVGRLRAVIQRDLYDLHRSREDVLHDLEALRVLVRDRGRVDLEDAILDVMDCVTGWCAPSARL
jgi:hypothetical protein